MLVADSSAVIEALIGAGATRLRERLRVPLIHAPALVDYEVLNVLRRSVQLREIGVDRAYEARVDFWTLPIQRYPAALLEARMWELRESVTIYDAAFVALSEALDLPLVTCDARLARAPSHAARIELFAPSA